MIRNATIAFAAALLLLAPTAARADLAAYNQNFEGLVQASPTALQDDGWLVFGNVFSPTFVYLYGYGPYPAPNNTGAFSGIATGQGGATQGAQQLVVYSDYNNGDHANGNLIESNVYREQTVGAADVGSTWEFTFDAKKGDLAGASTALAFIKTLNPNAGWAMTNFITLDMTAIPATWGTYTISLPIDASLVGQVLQIGFASTATPECASVESMASASSLEPAKAWKPTWEPNVSAKTTGSTFRGHCADGVYGGGNDTQSELTFDAGTNPALVTGSWVGLEVPLSAFTGLAGRAHLAQLVLSGDTRTVFVDNVYLHQ